ncbi:MAG TPA: GNAT family N-acetyltransferase [Pyrinomonadaceae bacterium]|jgi:ribosomal protein S18 acetylase RimI-like enzyme
MVSITFDNDSDVIQYNTAQISDSDQIVSLNLLWVNAFEKGNFQKGFVRYAFSRDEIISLIKANEVVVARNDFTVVGYYLINSLFEKEIGRIRRKTAELQIAAGTLPGARYVYQCQAAVHPDYQNKGIGKMLLSTLKRQVQSQFDIIISGINKDNEYAKSAHLKSGWVIVCDNGGEYLVYTKTGQ